MVQTRQYFRSTKPTRKHNRPNEHIPKEVDETCISNKRHIKTTHIRKLYTDDTGRFPVISRTGNQYYLSHVEVAEKKRTAAKWKKKLDNRRAQKNESAIVDSGASGMYLTKHAPRLKVRYDAPPIQVGTASGEAHRSSSTCELAIPNLPADFPVRDT